MADIFSKRKRATFPKTKRLYKGWTVYSPSWNFGKGYPGHKGEWVADRSDDPDEKIIAGKTLSEVKKKIDKKSLNYDLHTDHSIPCKACGSSRHKTFMCGALGL